MKKIFKIITSILLGSLLLSCSSNVLYPSRYNSKCFYIDAPSKQLYLKSKERFVLTYPNSFEKTMGIWKVNKDTLQLITMYQGSLLDKDSIPLKENHKFLIKGKKLIDTKNKKCFLFLVQN